MTPRRQSVRRHDRRSVTRIANRMWRRADALRRADGLRWAYDNDVLAYLLRHEFKAAWVGFGSNRIVLPIGPGLVFKMGHPEAMRDEQHRWSVARRDPASRRWLLPVLAGRTGAWSVMPYAAPLSDMWRAQIDQLQASALRDAAALRGVEDDLGSENWGLYRGRPVVIDYGGMEADRLAYLQQIGLANDQFGGWSVRRATASDPKGGQYGNGPWAAEKDGLFVHRFGDHGAAWRFVRQAVHPGGQRPWKGQPNDLPNRRLVSVQDGDEYDWLAGDGESIAHQVGIRIADYEEPVFAVIKGGDTEEEVLGAAFAGVHDAYGDAESAGELRFTVVVDPDEHRRGIGRMLVRAIKEHYAAQRQALCEEHGMPWLDLVAWVVNPNMAELLESEGFDADGEWSQDSPMMRWDG